MRKYPYITRISYKQGHEIENHGYSHLIMRRISQEQIVWEIKQTEKLIKQTTGIKPAYFRPPYGEIAPQILNASRHSGYRIVRWSVDPRDWNQTQKAPTIIRNVEKKIKPGDILLFHDGGANEREMITAVRTIIRDMKKDGYRFVTISTLIKNG